MEESDEETIVLPLEIDVYEESYEKGYEDYENLFFFNAHIPDKVLKLVFQQLNNSDLESVAMVCRSWSKAAKEEICLRKPYCFIQHYARNLNCTHKTRLMQSLDYVKESNIKPSIGFFFLPFNITAENEEKKYVDHMKGRISELLPQNHEAIYIVLFSYNADHPSIKDLEHLHPNTAYTLLSQIPKINMFEVTEHNLKGYKYKEYIQMIEGVTRRNHETSTCFMLFCNHDGFNVASEMSSLALCNDHDEDNIASMCGGLVDKVRYVHSNKTFVEEESNDKKPYCVALLISGFIQTWSIIINKKHMTKEKILDTLLSFKNRIKLQRNSVGFMFTTAERQLHLYHNYEGKHYESTIFKRLFPKVPLINCFVKCAFGKNTCKDIYVPNCCDCDKKSTYSTMCEYPATFDQFSTVFMILTYT